MINRNPIILAAMLLGLVVTLASCDKQSEPAGGKTVIGLITNNPNGLRNVEGFRDELTGLLKKQGKEVEFRFNNRATPRAELEATLQSFLDEPVDLIFTAGTPTGVAAFRVSEGSGIPVVFGVIADPVAAGVMSDLSLPGGNLTGVKLARSQARRLAIFSELVPNARRILVPYNPNDTAPASAVAQIKPVAAQLELELVTVEAPDNAAVERLLAEMPAVDAIFLVPDSIVNRRLSDILDLAEQRQIPVSGPSAAQVEAGALMTYGFIHREAGRQAARIADRVLRGAAPAKTPVETAESYLQLNTASAERIGLEISDDLLQRADVIMRVDGRSAR